MKLTKIDLFEWFERSGIIKDMSFLLTNEIKKKSK